MSLLVEIIVVEQRNCSMCSSALSEEREDGKYTEYEE